MFESFLLLTLDVKVREGNDVPNSEGKRKFTARDEPPPLELLRMQIEFALGNLT
jgi:hypothetical protein